MKIRCGTKYPSRVAHKKNLLLCSLSRLVLQSAERSCRYIAAVKWLQEQSLLLSLFRFHQHWCLSSSRSSSHRDRGRTFVHWNFWYWRTIPFAYKSLQPCRRWIAILSQKNPPQSSLAQSSSPAWWKCLRNNGWFATLVADCDSISACSSMQCELLFGGTTTNPRKREECIDLLFVLANSRTTAISTQLWQWI